MTPSLDGGTARHISHGELDHGDRHVCKQANENDTETGCVMPAVWDGPLPLPCMFRFADISKLPALTKGKGRLQADGDGQSGSWKDPPLRRRGGTPKPGSWEDATRLRG